MTPMYTTVLQDEHNFNNTAPQFQPTRSDNYIMRLILFWPRQKCHLWCNACHPCAQTSSVIWQHRNAPRWVWREIRCYVGQVVRGRGHSNGMEQRTNIKFHFKLRKTAVETVEMMRQVYGGNCLSRLII